MLLGVILIATSHAATGDDRVLTSWADIARRVRLGWTSLSWCSRPRTRSSCRLSRASCCRRCRCSTCSRQPTIQMVCSLSTAGPSCQCMHAPCDSLLNHNLTADHVLLSVLEAGTDRRSHLGVCRDACGKHGVASHWCHAQRGPIHAEQLHASGHADAAHDSWLQPGSPRQCDAQGSQEWQGPPSHHRSQDCQACS